MPSSRVAEGVRKPFASAKYHAPGATTTKRTLDKKRVRDAQAGARPEGRTAKRIRVRLSSENVPDTIGQLEPLTSFFNDELRHQQTHHDSQLNEVDSDASSIMEEVDVMPAEKPTVESCCFFKENEPLLKKDGLVPSQLNYRSELYAWLLAFKLSTNASDAQMQLNVNRENGKIVLEKHKLPTWETMKKHFVASIPFKVLNVVFCPQCKQIAHRAEGPIPNEIECPEEDCLYPIYRSLKEKECSFVYVRVRDQIKSYLEAGKLPKLIERAASIPRSKLSIGTHSFVKFPIALNMVVACDAAAITNRSRVNVYPTMLFFGQIPVCYQIRFPVIGSFSCAFEYNLPPAQTLFEPLVEEIEDLEKTPIVWWNGKEEVRTLVHVTICQSDAKEKCQLMNMYTCWARFGCPYCYAPGSLVAKKPGAAMKHVVYSRQVYSTSTRPRRRTEEQQLYLAKLAAEELAYNNKVLKSTKNFGVKGYPVLSGLKYYDLIWSNTPDTLHVVYEGFLKKIVHEELIGLDQKKEKTHPKKFIASYKQLDELQAKLHRVSELTHLPPSLSHLSTWTALSYYGFLMAMVTLVCFKNIKQRYKNDDSLYKVLVYLANAVYYLHYGIQTRSIRKKAKKNIKLFSSEYRKYFGKEKCIPKYHWFQHFLEFVLKHGAAFLFDSFVLERLLGILKQSAKTCRCQQKHIIEHFLLSHHSPLLNNTERFDKLPGGSKTREQIRDMGFDLSYFTNLGCYSKNKPEGIAAKIPDEHTLLLREHLKAIKHELCHDDVRFERHSRIGFRNMTLSSKEFPHNQNVRDCYCVLKGNFPGQIVDICKISGTDSFFVVVQEHKRVPLTTTEGLVLISPDNQFPVQKTSKKLVFSLNDQLFLQKVLLVEDFEWGGKVMNLFCVRPNEWFNF